MISYRELLDLRIADQPITWTDREVMLYALGLGMGSDPMNEEELPFVFEKDLKVMPTFATILAVASHIPAYRLGLNPVKVLHGEQYLVQHRPLPGSGRIISSTRVTGAVDKGPKGAIVILETVLKGDDDGALFATLTSAVFVREDGGFGGPRQGGPEPHQRPARAKDLTLEFPTRRDQALLYRLSGDRNPLHADPKVAVALGLERPILHGLCTFGISCRAVLKAYADYRPEQLVSHQLRFSAPVFPGETIAIDLWRDGDVVSFEGRVKERDQIVVKNGKSVMRASKTPRLFSSRIVSNGTFSRPAET